MTDDRRALIQQALANASERLLRERFAGLAGLQYGKDRDVYTVAGYPEKYTFAHGWDRYRRQDIARRIVDMPVLKTWRHPPTAIVDGEHESEFQATWGGLWDRLGLQSAFQRADRMAAIGEYSVVMLGFAGAATDRQLAQPVDGLSGPEDVLYARPYKQSDVTIREWVTDAADERFGLPLRYRINLSGGDSQFSAHVGTVDVHWTRVLHIVEDPLDSEVYGLPRLENVLNRLIDLEKLAASTGEAYWQLIVPILKAQVPPETAMDKDDLDDLSEKMEDMVHDLRRHVISNLDISYLESDHAPDPSAAADFYMMLIAAASGIPKRILFGTETGQRASEQDERAWLGSIGERIEQYAEPTVVRGLLDRLGGLGALDVPEGLVFEWPSLFEMTELQQAEVDQARAETAAELTPMGGDPMTRAMVTESGRVKLIPSEAEG